MNKFQEQVALNKFATVENLAHAKEIKIQLEAFGDERLNSQIKTVIEKSEENFESANELFWQTFQYPLQVFDLKNGEKPNKDESVYVFDEIDEDWTQVELGRGGFFFVRGLAIFTDIERYHRWARFPILEKEPTGD